MKDQNEMFDILKDTTDKLTSSELIDDLAKVVSDKVGIELSDAKQTVKVISETIDNIDKSYKELKSAKEAGQNRIEWLRDKIDKQISAYLQDEKNHIVSEVKNALDSSSTDIGTELFGEDLKLTKQLPSLNYEGLNKQVIIDDFQEQIKNNTLLGAVVYEDGQFKIDENHKEIEAVKKYYEEQLDSKYDTTFKKAASVAFDIAKEKDLLPKKLKNKTPEDIAMLVDKGLTASKVAYKVANGELNQIDAVEYTIDRSVSMLNSIIVSTTTRYGGQAGEFIGSKIGSLFGPAGAVAGGVIGRVVGKYAGKVVGDVVNKGVKMVASGLKSVVKSVGGTIKSVGSKIASFFGF